MTEGFITFYKENIDGWSSENFQIEEVYRPHVSQKNLVEDRVKIQKKVVSIVFINSYLT
jgi:hypothetical protein